MKGTLFLVTLLATAAVMIGPASAEPRLYVIAIGNNTPPPDGGERGGPVMLRYADDDASAFFEFARPAAARASLLGVLDPESQRRFPELLDLARPPSLEQLLRTVAEMKQDMLADLRRGDEPRLLFFYSGHGSRGAAGRPAALMMSDGELTQRRLYDEILAVLPARAVHLLVDACYAADVVRPRDLEAKVVDASDGDLARLVEATTLERFPHVGAVLAASATGETHEWDAYRQGVFTHQVLSGLRGGADVNGDGAVEYSELLAFVAAANREVSDPRARLHVVARPPAIDRRLPIIDLTRLHRAARLRAGPLTPGYFFIEDRRGDRLIEMRPETGYRFQLYLPPAETLFLVSGAGTAEFESGSGEQPIALESLVSRSNGLRARGAMSAAMKRGLFAGTFGPNYYRGFVDSAPELVAVDFGRGGQVADGVVAAARPPSAPPSTTARPWSPSTVAILGAATALAVTSGAFGVLAGRARDDFDRTQFERAATEADARFTRDRAIAIGTGVAAAAALGVAGWMIWHRGPRGEARQEVMSW